MPSRHTAGHASWDRAIGVANHYARQDGQRYEVRGVQTPTGWRWRVRAVQPTTALFEPAVPS